MEHLSETAVWVPVPVKGVYLKTFDEFIAMCEEKDTTKQFVFEKITPDHGLVRESRGIDISITAVPFGKPITHIYTPLSDSPNKRFFIDDITELEQYQSDSHKDTFNYLRWYVDTTDQSLNWTITHTFHSIKNKLFFNSSTNGFRVYVLQ